MFLELRHLRTLVELRDTGSLVAAAERLHLTQSALSHQLKALEDYLDTPLLVRKTRPMRFTSAGQHLLNLADQILPQVDQAEKQLSRIKRGNTGRLHIAVECHSCFDWLMPTLDIYRKDWPEVELDLSTGFDFNPLDSLLRADVDVIITSDIRETERVTYLPLFRYQVLMGLPKQHPLSHKEYLEPDDLRSETLITYPVEPERLDIFTRFLTPAKISPHAVRHSEIPAMTLQLVASGKGLAPYPCWVLNHKELRKNDIHALPLGSEGLWGTLYAAVRAEESKTPYLQAFVEQARHTSFNVLEGVTPLRPGQ